jgi:hypothetical protein
MSKPNEKLMHHSATPPASLVGIAVSLILFLFAGPAFAQVALDSDFSGAPSWKAPTAGEVRAAVFDWLQRRNPDDAVLAQVHKIWPEQAGAEADKTESTQLLQRVVTTFAFVDPAAKQVVEFCSKPQGAEKTPGFAVISDDKTPAFERNNLRLWLGQSLTQDRMYDEGLAQLTDLQPADVVDPAALLFYQSVGHHWMLHKEEGLKAIGRLLEQKQNIPRRYQELAELMQADLADLEDESLDHISRRMNDVTRRLDFGNAGKKVRSEEDGIVASLDKKIKQLEDMAKAMGGGNGSGDGGPPGNPGDSGDPQGIRSRSPASDTRLARGKGAGEVKNKNIGSHNGWGDLPPKEREEAMQQISKDFPSHYRDVIEQYFRKLASEDEDQK